LDSSSGLTLTTQADRFEEADGGVWEFHGKRRNASGERRIGRVGRVVLPGTALGIDLRAPVAVAVAVAGIPKIIDISE